MRNCSGRRLWRSGHRPGTARATRQPRATCGCPVWRACCPPMTQPWTRGCESRTGNGGWRWTRRALAVGAPDMGELLARSQAPVTLARGENDPMNTDEQLARLGAPTVTLPGLGHNAHVESPELSITLLGQWVSLRAGIRCGARARAGSGPGPGAGGSPGRRACPRPARCPRPRARRPRRRLAPSARACSAALARSGVGPMFARAIRPSTAATPTMAQSLARRTNFW